MCILAEGSRLSNGQGIVEPRKRKTFDIERFRVEAKAEMQQEGERIRQETAAQIARLEIQAQQDIEMTGKLARRELKSYAAKLSLDLAEQRVRERLDPAAEAGLVDAFILWPGLRIDVRDCSPEALAPTLARLSRASRDP